MKRSLSWLIFLIALSPSIAAAEGVVLSMESLEAAGQMQPLDHGWKYHPGDDPAWADPDFDDGSWEVIDSLFELDRPPASGWPGIGWFRVHFEAAEDLWNTPILLGTTIHFGAYELYIDGRQVVGKGRVGRTREQERFVHMHEVPLVTPVVLDAKREHVIAVRFSYHRSSAYAGGGDFPVGAEVQFGRPVLDVFEYSRPMRRALTQHVFFVGAGCIVVLVHLLLFITYPAMVANLYYALFTFFAVMIALLPLKMPEARTLVGLIWVFRTFEISLALTSITGLRFLYSIFYDHLPKYFWFWVGLGVVAVASSWHTSPQRVLIYNLLSFVEIARILVLAIVRKKRHAWLVAAGVIAFIGASAVQIVAEIMRVPVSDFLYLHGLVAMLVLMSLYLALGYGETNRNLQKQLTQVKSLSDDALEHERRLKEQEVARMQLEADNALKAKELEEARKRQAVLDELAETNEELRQTQSQLVQSEKMAALGSLVAGVAHEINTPLGAINSMHNTLTKAVGRLRSTLLQLDPDVLQSNESVGRTFKAIDDANTVIRSGSERVTDIVRRLRSFARLDEAELQKVDIHQGLDDTLTLVHHELKHGITVHKKYGDVPPINCYAGQLNQVFLNMLMNARQAIAGEGEITIETRHEGNKVYIRFTDSGKGIAEEHIGKIFDPGFTTKGVGVGTGLGLSICYQIVKAHKGQIKVTSEVGKGTTFTIIVPSDLDEASLA